MGKRQSLLHPNTVQGSFFPLQSYFKKTLRKNVPKSARKYKRNVLIPPGHPIKLLNPLSPNGDQHIFSPNDIHTLSRDKVMRIHKMITKEKCFDLLSNSLHTFLKEMYKDQFGEIVGEYWA